MSSKAPHVKQTLLNVISVAGCVTSIPAPHMEHGSNRVLDVVRYRTGRDVAGIGRVRVGLAKYYIDPP